MTRSEAVEIIPMEGKKKEKGMGELEKKKEEMRREGKRREEKRRQFLKQHQHDSGFGM